MATYLDYIQYFSGIANKYLANSPTNKTFYKKGLDEFLNSLTLDGNYPAMLLNKYDYGYNDKGSDNVMKDRTIAFIVFDHVADIQDYDAIDIAIDNSEIIVDKIYNQIREDRRNPECNAFLSSVDMSSFEISPVANYADGNFGFFVILNISSTHNTIVS